MYRFTLKTGVNAGDETYRKEISRLSFQSRQWLFCPFCIYSSAVIMKQVGGLELCNHSSMVPFNTPVI